SSLATCCIVFVAVLMPPLAVFEIKGCNGDFWINFLLTLLAYFPGLIHAVYIIIKY
ncbi:plasma membrane proteolipid Pmp3, partial [Paraphysoderma sedebokerense]